jgi:hypothetical protein
MELALIIILGTVVFLFNTWFVTRRALIAFERGNLDHTLDGSDRGLAVITGLATAVIFPVVSVLGILLYDFLVTETSVLTTPNEKAATKKAELEAENKKYREILKEYGLKDPIVEAKLND